ncbi:MAG: hypothetical protein HYY36_05670 [Gammaproteobacteria bacterium]|nr:hypothetical protein [Gammaproteobacteria bacterium]
MSESCDFVLAIDQGSHSSRALVFDSQGSIHAHAEIDVPTLSPAPGFVEHDPDVLVDSVEGAAMAALARAGLRPGTGIKAALATQRSTIVCWDRGSGRALSPAISWQDRRNAAWLERLDPHAESIRLQTGLFHSPHYGASKLRWCLDYLPEVAAAARAGRLACGPLASFLLARITREGSFLIDPANASRTLLWSPHTGDWSSELLGLVGVDRAWLPAPVPTAHPFGHLRTAQFEIPIAVMTGDQSSVPFAFGPLDPHTIYINIGTGAFLQRQAAGPVAPPLLASILYADQARRIFAMEGTVNGAGAALRWLGETRHIDAAAIARTLAGPPLEHRPTPLFRNTVGGLGSPWWRAGGIEPGFIRDGSPEALTASVLESIAFLINENLEVMRAQSPGAQRVVVTGGLSRSPFLVQALADVSGLCVRRPDQTEATARGAAALVLGPDQDLAAPAHVDVSPRKDGNLDSRYAEWREMMRQAAAY